MHDQQQPVYATAHPSQGQNPAADADHACSTGASDAHGTAHDTGQAQPPKNTMGQGQAFAPQSGAQAGMYGNPQSQAYSLGQGNGASSQGGMMRAGYPQQPGMAYQPGPDMGQPHFSSQFPGAAPYQGAPMAGGNGVQAPVYGWQGPHQDYPQTQGFPQQNTDQAGYPHPVTQFPQPPRPFTPVYQNPGPQVHPASTAAPSPGRGQENRYGELYGLIQEAANGNADVSGFLRFFQSTSSDFWKGALVGTGLTLLLTNDAVKSAIARGFAGVWGLLGKSAEDKEAEEDRKAEKSAAKEQ